MFIYINIYLYYYKKYNIIYIKYLNSINIIYITKMKSKYTYIIAIIIVLLIILFVMKKPQPQQSTNTNTITNKKPPSPPVVITSGTGPTVLNTNYNSTTLTIYVINSLTVANTITFNATSGPPQFFGNFTLTENYTNGIGGIGYDGSNYLNFYTPIGIHENKIISITNKQLSFLVQKYTFLGFL